MPHGRKKEHNHRRSILIYVIDFDKVEVEAISKPFGYGDVSIV